MAARWEPGFISSLRWFQHTAEIEGQSQSPLQAKLLSAAVLVLHTSVCVCVCVDTGGGREEKVERWGQLTKKTRRGPGAAGRRPPNGPERRRVMFKAKWE